MKVLTNNLSSAEAPLSLAHTDTARNGWHTDSPDVATAARQQWHRVENTRRENLRRELYRSDDYNAASYSGVGFRRIEPEASPENRATESEALQKRLDVLCERMRAKY